MTLGENTRGNARAAGMQHAQHGKRQDDAAWACPEQGSELVADRGGGKRRRGEDQHGRADPGTGPEPKAVAEQYSETARSTRFGAV